MTHPIDTPQEVLLQIRQGKIRQTEKLFTAIMIEPRLIEMFRNNPDEASYEGYLNKCYAGADNLPLVDMDLGTLPPERMQEIGQSMQRSDYKAPDEPNGQVEHLFAMRTLYKAAFTWPPAKEDLWLDLSFTNLMVKINQGIIFRLAKGERELPRIKNIKAIKKKVLNENQRPVYETFYKLTIKEGTKFEQVAIEIFERLRQVLKDPPAMPTIRRYLKADPMIMARFKSKGRNLIYHI